IYGGGIARPEGASRTRARGRACSKKAGEQAQSVAAAALANDSASVCRKSGRGASGTLENADVTAGRTGRRCPVVNLNLVDAAWRGARSLMTHLCSLIWKSEEIRTAENPSAKPAEVVPLSGSISKHA